MNNNANGTDSPADSATGAQPPRRKRPAWKRMLLWVGGAFALLFVVGLIGSIVDPLPRTSVQQPVSPAASQAAASSTATPSTAPTTATLAPDTQAALAPALSTAPTAATAAPAPPTRATTQAAVAVSPTNSSPSQGASCPVGDYRNVDGACIQRPTQAPTAPAGATAKCVDGTYSFSQHRSGTCSGHGGVAAWL
jgi:cytoskeletal protein RodZ